MIKVLITGCAGFIGTNLAKFHLDKGNSVVGVDNFLSGSTRNIIFLKGYKDFTFVEADITETMDYAKDIDFIYNLACAASPLKYQRESLSTLDTCYLGTKNILEVAKNKRIPVLHASTSEVYGDPLEHPQTELYRGNVNTWGPRACYDEGKRVAETLCYEYQKQFDLQVFVPRIFNTYGPFMSEDDGRMIPNFIIQCLQNETITIYGDGTQTRSILYIDDLVNGFQLLLNSNIRNPVNLGSSIELTVMDLAQIIKGMVENCNSKFEFKMLPEDDPKTRQPKLDLANSSLNWTVGTDINTGLSRTIEYFQNRKKYE